MLTLCQRLIFITFPLSFLPLISSQKKPNGLSKELLWECQKKDYDVNTIKKYLELKADPTIIDGTVWQAITSNCETPLHAIMKFINKHGK